MKNKILLIISIGLSSFSIAQTTPSFGVRAGVSSSGIRGESMENLNKLLNYTNGMLTRSNNTGFFVGVNSSIPLGENFSVEPGIYYTQKGTQLIGKLPGKIGEISGVSAKSILQANYIDVPLMLKANVNGLKLFAGPQLSYLTDAHTKTTAGILGINFLNNSIDISNMLNRWDAAITGGIGYEFVNGINIVASYDYGLLKNDANRKTAAYNQSFKVGIGMNF